MARGISELPFSNNLPNEYEFVLPVYLDNTDNCLKKLSVTQIIDSIKDEVTSGGEISVVEVENGFKFYRNEGVSG